MMMMMMMIVVCILFPIERNRRDFVFNSLERIEMKHGAAAH